MRIGDELNILVRPLHFTTWAGFVGFEFVAPICALLREFLKIGEFPSFVQRGKGSA